MARKKTSAIFVSTALAISFAFVESRPATAIPAQTESHISKAGQDEHEQANAPGAKVYSEDCAICHGDNMEGNLPGFPPLAGVGRHMSDKQITALVRQGKGRMPAFGARLSDADLKDLLRFLDNSQALPVSAVVASSGSSDNLSPQAQAGSALFQQNCAFCHGRDAEGGETGPDLTQSRLVKQDIEGNKIGDVIRNGRPDKKMPAFNFSRPELLSVVAFIHARTLSAAANKGGRRGVEVEDLQTGNAAAGKAYFYGAGGCAKCHSPTGDLAGVASRYEGLELEERMLYPKNAESKVTVTLSSGEKISGTLAYLDEFTVGLRDSAGTYRSWSIPRVKYVVDSPVDAHVALFPKYSDDDIHNLMAYIQTLK